MLLPTLAVALVLLAIVFVLYFVFATFAVGAGYQPAPRSVVERMLSAGEVTASDRLYDLGAGTGAIVFRAARERGASVVAVEAEPLRVLILRIRRLVGGPRDRVSIRWGDLFQVDFRAATVVTVFLWPRAMERLRPLFEAQLAPGTRVVSYWHPVPGWTAVSEDRPNRIYLYRLPEPSPGP